MIKIIISEYHTDKNIKTQFIKDHTIIEKPDLFIESYNQDINCLDQVLIEYLESIIGEKPTIKGSDGDYGLVCLWLGPEGKETVFQAEILNREAYFHKYC